MQLIHKTIPCFLPCFRLADAKGKLEKSSKPSDYFFTATRYSTQPMNAKTQALNSI